MPIISSSISFKKKHYKFKEKKSLNAYSLIYESPFSQISTILAFGLHSDIANCNASVIITKKILKPIKNQI
jgi:hypothetical protein